MDEDHMGDPAPLPHEPRARLQRDRRRGFNRAAAQRVGASSLQLPCGRRGDAAIRPLLRLVTDPSDQEIAGEPRRRRHPMKPPPLPAQLEDGQLREPHERLCGIDRPFFHVSDRAAFRCGSGERPHRARQEPAHAVLLPVGRLHHCFDTGPFGLAQKGEHALLLGHSLSLWFVGLPQRLGGGDSLGLRFNRSRRFLGGGRDGRDLTPGCRL